MSNFPFLGETEFYRSLPDIEKRVYHAYFANPKASRKVLAYLADCKRSVIDTFLGRPELKEEVGRLFFEGLNSLGMLEVVSQMFSAAQLSNGFKDRNKLLDELISAQKNGGAPKNVTLVIYGKDEE